MMIRDVLLYDSYSWTDSSLCK